MADFSHQSMCSEIDPPVIKKLDASRFAPFDNQQVKHERSASFHCSIVSSNDNRKSAVPINKIGPSRLCQFDIQPTDASVVAQKVDQIKINKLGKSRLAQFEQSSVCAAQHKVQSTPIVNKLDSSRLFPIEQPNFEPSTKVTSSPMYSKPDKKLVAQLDHQVPLLMVLTDNNRENIAHHGTNITPLISRATGNKELQPIPIDNETMYVVEQQQTPTTGRWTINPLTSPTGRRGGIMAPTIASSSKQKAKFQAVDNSSKVGKGRWNMNPKPNLIGAPNSNKLQAKFKNLCSHMGPRESTNCDSVTSNDKVSSMMELNSVPLLPQKVTHIPSPTGRRGGVMAPTIASSAKQRAKFQAVENSRRIGKERWHTNAKPHHGVSNNDLPGNFKNMYSHIGPRVSTTWDHTDGPEDDDNTSDNEVKNKVDDLASSNEMEPDDYEEYSKTEEFEQLPFEERLKLFKKHQRFLRSLKKPDLETELHEERKAYMELFKRSCQYSQEVIKKKNTLAKRTIK